jgi:hypothetical protein
MDKYLGQYNWIKPSWFEEGFKKGLRQGMRQGMQREAELVLRQIKKKFGKLKKADEEQILALPIEKIEELGEALLDFKNADNLHLWLNQVSQDN